MGFNTFPCNPYPISTEELNKGNNDDLNTRVAALESDVSDLNSNKANQITIAPFFNAETAYTEGDLVYYNGLSYRCTNDHEGAWDADDFAATTIANELDSLKSGLTDIDNFTFTATSGYTSLYLTAQKLGRLRILSVQVDGSYTANNLVTIGTVSERPNTESIYLIPCTISNASGSPLNVAVAYIDTNGDVMVAPAVDGGRCTISAIWFA